jgi:hypothetical protein
MAGQVGARPDRSAARAAADAAPLGPGRSCNTATPHHCRAAAPACSARAQRRTAARRRAWCAPRRGRRAAAAPARGRALRPTTAPGASSDRAQGAPAIAARAARPPPARAPPAPSLPRQAAFVGAIAVADLVKSTLGPKGMDKILQSMGRGQEVTVTNDGATILKSIHVDNPAAKVLVGERRGARARGAGRAGGRR